jgi:hypothetical protein
MIKLLILIHTLMPQSLAQSPLDGIWKQSCHNNIIRTETFEASFVMLQENYFSDVGCTKPLMQFTSFGAYSTNTEQMDFRFMSAIVTLNTENLVKDFNRRKVCGFANWKINEDKNLVGLVCRFFNEATNSKVPDEDEMRYGIYKIEGDRLYLGQLTPSKNALTPEARPTEWNPQFYTRVQNSVSLQSKFYRAH